MMRNLIDRISLPKHWVYSIFSMALIIALLAMPLQQMRTTAQNSDRSAAPGGKGKLADDGLDRLGTKEQIAGLEGVDVIDAPPEAQKGSPAGATPLTPQVGTDQGTESEPNDTLATADALTGMEGRIKGYAVPGTPDIDYFGPFNLAVGDRVYATAMTNFSPGSTDSILELRDSADVLVEQDLNDGSFSTTSSVIAGRAITVAGNYYLRVRENGTATMRPYYLYFSIESGAPTAEVEPNGTTATATALPASGWVSGTRDPASDADFFSMTLAAGDTVAILTDIDPERDNVQWNARTGMALFGTGSTQILVADDASTGTVANPLGEAFVMTVRDAGTYYAYIDSAVAATAGPTLTYNISVLVIPAESSTGCTTFTNSTPTPIADLALSSSTIVVPSTGDRIRDLNVYMNGTHTFINDLDIHLRSPNGGGNDNGVFTDIGPATVGGAQTSFNWWANDEAGIPSSFAIADGMRWMPDNAYRLDWFDGEDPGGIWTLDIRDDASGDVGTLTSWSLEVCTDPAPVGNLLYNEDFEAGMGGYTHNGTADEWEYGLPNTTATTVSPARAAFLTCNSGVNCWKTDLDNTYDISSSQNLVSPTLTLNQFIGSATLYWSMRYQMESATFDHAWVDVTEVGNPTNTRRVWQWYGATMADTVGNPTVTMGASAGWGRYSADISSFLGVPITITFHVDSDNTVNYPGMAIDDVQIRHLGTVAASVNVGGRVLTSGGRGLSNARVTLTDTNGIVRTAITNGFGYYNFEDVMVGRSYVVATTRKGYNFNPIVFTPLDNIVDLDLVADP
jgi:subtilisin-like proprotein convertase family protein